MGGVRVFELFNVVFQTGVGSSIGVISCAIPDGGSGIGVFNVLFQMGGLGIWVISSAISDGGVGYWSNFMCYSRWGGWVFELFHLLFQMGGSSIGVISCAIPDGGAGIRVIYCAIPDEGGGRYLSYFICYFRWGELGYWSFFMCYSRWGGGSSSGVISCAIPAGGSGIWVISLAIPGLPCVFDATLNVGQRYRWRANIKPALVQSTCGYYSQHEVGLLSRV